MQQINRKPILILDANAFISCSKIVQFGKKYRLITTSDVIQQLKDQKTKQYLQKLPYQIQQKTFDQKSLQFVKQFAKKTGDIGSLSDVDIQLVALCHTLYVQQGLKGKLRKQPPPITTKNLEYQHQQQGGIQENQQQDEQQDQEQTEQPQGKQNQQGWITVPLANKKQQSQEQSDLDDQQGWITPNNYDKKMAEINTAYLENTKEQNSKKEVKKLDENNKQQTKQGKQQQEIKQNKDQKQQQTFEIALISADYAIQNVSTQMGIKLISLDGRVIASIRRFIWQCYLCWKQYKISQNKVKLCSNCGYNSLSKVAYSLDNNGNAILHRKKGWKPNLKVQEWKERKFEEQQKRKKHQHERRTKKISIFDP